MAWKLIPSRRTATVLLSLIGAMTAVSYLLLNLVPSPVAPVEVIRLSSLNRANHPEEMLFHTTPSVPRGQWEAIVVQFSDSKRGSASSLNELHERQGRGGLVHHFVIGNDQGSADGQIQVGFRWRSQLAGAHASGDHENWFNQHSISICLIGEGGRIPPTSSQMRELVWLVNQLQAKLGIGPDRVLVEADSTMSGRLPRFFPIARFRQQLLSSAAP